jgi:peptidoglycan/xylan/chitin deacetylase (PgdA/CDA1 family)
MVQKITAESEGKNHVVMLAHDSGAKSETLAALPQIIEYYKNNGYSFKVIDGNVDISFAQFIDY